MIWRQIPTSQRNFHLIFVDVSIKDGEVVLQRKTEREKRVIDSERGRERH